MVIIFDEQQPPASPTLTPPHSQPSKRPSATDRDSDSASLSTVSADSATHELSPSQAALEHTVTPALPVSSVIQTRAPVLYTEADRLLTPFAVSQRLSARRFDSYTHRSPRSPLVRDSNLTLHTTTTSRRSATLRHRSFPRPQRSADSLSSADPVWEPRIQGPFPCHAHIGPTAMIGTTQTLGIG